MERQSRPLFNFGGAERRKTGRADSRQATTREHSPPQRVRAGSARPPPAAARRPKGGALSGRRCGRVERGRENTTRARRSRCQPESKAISHHRRAGGGGAVRGRYAAPTPRASPASEGGTCRPADTRKKVSQAKSHHARSPEFPPFKGRARVRGFPTARI